MLGDLGKAEVAVKAKVFKKTEKYFLYPVSRHDRGRQGERLVLCKSRQRERTYPFLWRLQRSIAGSYMRNLGFVAVEEVLLGKWKARKDGMLCPGGEGFKIWGMSWRPEVVA
jgi:hypothetical protein